MKLNLTNLKGFKKTTLRKITDTALDSFDAKAMESINLDQDALGFSTPNNVYYDLLCGTTPYKFDYKDNRKVERSHINNVCLLHKIFDDDDIKSKYDRLKELVEKMDKQVDDTVMLEAEDSYNALNSAKDLQNRMTVEIPLDSKLHDKFIEFYSRVTGDDGSLKVTPNDIKVKYQDNDEHYLRIINCEWAFRSKFVWDSKSYTHKFVGLKLCLLDGDIESDLFNGYAVEV